MRKIFIILLTVCTLFIMLGFLPVHGEAEIYDNVLRLHVIANSDSDHDQALKLKVRDAMLEGSSELFLNCADRNAASAAIEENRALLESLAQTTIFEEGYDYEVKIELGEEKYPTRSYGEVCFPAGNYLSLRVIIGEGAGQNWWCVLFPPMCLSAASDNVETVPLGLTGEQYKLITETDDPKYTVRFKILEVFAG
ncbi:MAG: stage II sporulation protein R [Ruminococcaceae bacterium]|nr:stage II sporulation protein R [Oscillospiraceae bacterium]